jgi:ammonium transporter, Amt family
VYCVLAIEKVIDDPVGALSAHGIAGVWGTIAVGLFATPRLIDPETASPGLWYGIIGESSFDAGLGQLAVQAVGVAATFTFVLVASLGVFYAIKMAIGLRIPEEQELAGLDISTHGMYGYPEQFIPPEEYPTPLVEPHVAGTPVGAAPATAPAQRPTSG